MAKYLFQNQTTNANGVAYTLQGGANMLIVRGTWNGASIKLQASDDGTNFVDLVGAVFSADAGELISLPALSTIRAVLSGAGASTSLTVALV